MINLLHSLRATEVKANEIAVCSLGQAGYIYKTHTDKYVVIDPYLTNFCENRIGKAFKRHIPILLEPQELEQLPITAYLLTHHHEDHLDVECIEALSPNHTFPFYAPPDSIKLLKELAVSEERCNPLADGTTYEIEDITIHSVFADHGEIAPDAVGIIVQFAGKTIYHMGDTCLREAEFHKIAEKYSIDLLLLPINGKYGNMTEQDAAKAVAILKPKVAVPCHFWSLPGNSGGDPLAFFEAVDQLIPATDTLMFTQGEIFIV